MANTYTQIYIQVVFAVAGREALIRREHKEELCKYITGVVRNKEQKLIAINGMPDHLHVLVGLEPGLALSDLVRDVKANSSRFINESGWFIGRFSWQEGFGAFSYGRSQLSTVIRYIEDQERHHAKRSFKDEYLTLLRKFDIAFDEKYVFKFFDNDEQGTDAEHIAPPGLSG